MDKTSTINKARNSQCQKPLVEYGRIYKMTIDKQAIQQDYTRGVRAYEWE